MPLCLSFKIRTECALVWCFEHINLCVRTCCVGDTMLPRLDAPKHMHARCLQLVSQVSNSMSMGIWRGSHQQKFCSPTLVCLLWLRI